MIIVYFWYIKVSFADNKFRLNVSPSFESYIKYIESPFLASDYESLASPRLSMRTVILNAISVLSSRRRIGFLFVMLSLFWLRLL